MKGKRGTKKKVSIYDVARYANVSPASVSYVANGIDKVSEETKKRILKGIEELGYKPNQMATSLSTGHSRLIALFLPWKDASIAFLQNPFYGEFIGGFEKQISTAGYDLIIESLKNPSEFEDWATSRGIDGVVMLGRYPGEIYEGIKKLGIPTVLVDIYEDHAEEFCNVRINDEEGSYLATEYLIKHGHRNIGFAGGDLANSIIDQKRFHGYSSAMKDYDLPVLEKNVYDTTATFDGGYGIASTISENREMTGLVCAADILAIGIIRKYCEMGLNVPNDLSLVGFDDIQAALYIFPGLTTVHQDIGEKGRLAANLILDDLRKHELSKKTIVLEPFLVERQSVRKI